MFQRNKFLVVVKLAGGRKQAGWWAKQAGGDEGAVRAEVQIKLVARQDFNKLVGWTARSRRSDNKLVEANKLGVANKLVVRDPTSWPTAGGQQAGFTLVAIPRVPNQAGGEGHRRH